MNSGLDKVKCGRPFTHLVKGVICDLTEVEPGWKHFAPVQVVGFLMEGWEEAGGGASRSTACLAIGACQGALDEMGD